jgi:hypothetical protein
MSRMSELIYPDAPGFKVSGPSQQAAEAVGGNASKLRAAVLAQLATYPGGATAVSELKRLGQIKETGGRRKNESGMTATVWRTTSGADR